MLLPITVVSLPRTGSTKLAFLLAKAYNTDVSFINSSGQIHHTHTNETNGHIVRTFRRDIIEWLGSYQLMELTSLHNYHPGRNKHMFDTFIKKYGNEKYKIKDVRTKLDGYEMVWSWRQKNDICLFYEDWINDFSIIEKFSGRPIVADDHIGKIPPIKWDIIDKNDLVEQLSRINIKEYSFHKHLT